jgi:hypothetical protein
MREPAPLTDLLEKHMAARQLSMRALAKQTGVSWAYVYKVRHGKIPLAHERVDAWVKALGLRGDDATAFADAASWALVPNAIKPWIVERFGKGRQK